VGISVDQAEEEAGKTSCMPAERIDEFIESSDAYRSLSSAIAESCTPRMSHGGSVVDLHCGKGDLISILLSHAPGDCRFIGFDDEQANVDYCNDRFRSLVHQGFVHVDSAGIDETPMISSCLIIEAFGLRELTEKKTQETLERTLRSISKGGAMVIVESSNRPWTQLLKAAGFRDSRTIWSRDGIEAIIAER